MNLLRRRVERLERDVPGALVIVPVYPGMDAEEAKGLQFSSGGIPTNTTVVLLRNALPDPTEPYDWSDMSKQQRAERFRRIHTTAGQSGFERT
jgi:hypothetical protein